MARGTNLANEVLQPQCSAMSCNLHVLVVIGRQDLVLDSRTAFCGRERADLLELLDHVFHRLHRRLHVLQHRGTLVQHWLLRQIACTQVVALKHVNGECVMEIQHFLLHI